MRISMTLLILSLLVFTSANAQVSPMALLSTVPEGGPFRDNSHPDIAMGGDGTAVIVWQSREYVVGEDFGDWDIFTAHTTDNGQTWSAPEMLNSFGDALDETGNDTVPRIVTDRSGHWVAVWTSTHDMEGKGTDADILVSTSADNGMTWSEAGLLNSTAISDGGATDEKPWLATDGNGTWLVAWASDSGLAKGGNDKDILYARSTVNGASWSSAALLNNTGAFDSANDDEPYVVCGAGASWMITWQTTYNLDGITGADLDCAFSRSSDGGLSWSHAALFNPSGTVDDLANDYVPRAVSDGRGNWVSSWRSFYDLGTSGNDMEIISTYSSDDAATWSAPAYANTTANVDQGAGDWQPQIYTDGMGNWLCTWSTIYDIAQGELGTDYDNVIAWSYDYGQTWQDPVPMNSNAASDGASTDSVPKLASDHAGNWIGTWYSNVTNTGNAGGLSNIYTTRIFLENTNEVSASGLLATFDANDTNEDTLLDTGEIAATAYASQFDALDSNADGFLSVQELQRQTGQRKSVHSADLNADSRLSLSELVRTIQIFRLGRYGCAPESDSTEDGYQLSGPYNLDVACPHHTADTDGTPDRLLSLAELLRLVQLYNFGALAYCPDGSEDNFCAAQ